MSCRRGEPFSNQLIKAYKKLLISKLLDVVKINNE